VSMSPAAASARRAVRRRANAFARRRDYSRSFTPVVAAYPQNADARIVERRYGAGVDGRRRSARRRGQLELRRISSGQSRGGVDLADGVHPRSPWPAEA
jgi:hypothetical protein